jgi:hypothetical protein
MLVLISDGCFIIFVSSSADCFERYLYCCVLNGLVAVRMSLAASVFELNLYCCIVSYFLLDTKKF